MYDWLRGEKAPGVAAPLTPMQQYAKEFIAAAQWTAQQGLFVPPVQFLVEKDCIDWAVAEPELQRLIGPYSEEEIAHEVFAMNVRLGPELSQALGVPLQLTIGWYDIRGEVHHRHDQEMLRRLITQDPTLDTSRGLNLHVWLTSPAFEVIDLCLPTIVSKKTNNPDLARWIVYLSNQDLKPGVTYHPTAVGDEFLYRSGAVFGVEAPG